VFESSVGYRRSIELCATPPGRWQFAQFVCRYARARCASAADVSDGSGSDGCNAGSPSGVVNIVIASSVRS
jgi:hypothetical protein